MVAGTARTPYTSSTSGFSRRTRYEMMRAEMFAELQPHKPHLMDCADFVKPRRPRWFVGDRNRGDRRNLKIIDSTASFAHRTLQAGMHAGMTSPARPWVKLSTPDPDLNEFAPVKSWLHTVTKRMLVIFAKTNLYNVLPMHYGDMGAFATAATSIMDDDKDLFRAYNYPIGSYAIGSNHRGMIDKFAHQTNMSVAQIVEEYLLDRRANQIDWTNASVALKNCWDRGSFTAQVEVCWMVVPNALADPQMLDAKYLPFFSCHIESGQERDDTFLREKGYREFPVLVSRWDVTGNDDWGTDCPSMTALGDVKQLQTGEKRGGQGLEKMINPPLQAPTSVRNQKASLLPGDITYNDVREGQKGITPIHETNVALDKLEMKQQSIRVRIQRAFYEDLFLMLAFADASRGMQPPTATEIVERKEEKLIALGPVLERTNQELLDPLVDRAYAMMERMGLIPTPPRELQRMSLRVEYISILAQAQKLVGVAGLERFAQGVTALIPVFPDVRHKIDAMQLVDDYGDALGVNPKIIISDDAARAAAQAEQQAIRAQQEAMAAKDQAGALKDISQTDLASDNMLSRVMNGPQGGEAVPA